MLTPILDLADAQTQDLKVEQHVQQKQQKEAMEFAEKNIAGFKRMRKTCLSWHKDMPAIEVAASNLEKLDIRFRSKVGLFPIYPEIAEKTGRSIWEARQQLFQEAVPERNKLEALIQTAIPGFESLETVAGIPVFQLQHLPAMPSSRSLTVPLAIPLPFERDGFAGRTIALIL
jgi:hypothetical protein